MQQVPGYLAKQAELKAKGVSEVLVYCVNDGAVMEGWAKDQGIQGSMVSFLADTRSELTKALDLVLDAEPAMAVLGNPDANVSRLSWTMGPSKPSPWREGTC